MKKGLVIAVLLLSLVMVFGCVPRSGPSNQSEVFVSFFNESEEKEPTAVVVEEETTPTGEVVAEEGAPEEHPENVSEEGEAVEAPIEEETAPPEEEVSPEVPPTEETEPSIPVKTYQEGDLVKLSVKAVDPDNDNLVISYSPPLSEDGTWQTKEGDAGQYRVEVSVSDGEAQSTAEMLLIITPLNNPPVIEVPEDITVKEGETVTIEPVITDEDNDPVTVTYTGWMSSATYTTNYNDAGSYIVTVIASDGKATVAKDIKVNVQNVNRPPVIATLPPVSVIEGELIRVTPEVTDPDEDAITLSFTPPLDENGEWQTQEGDAGDYLETVTATDGIAVASQDFKIIVTPLNRPPVIQRIPDIVVKEGETVTLEPVIIDPDGDSFTVAYSGWMTTNTKTTGYDDAGSYVVTVTATDNKGASASLDVKVTVENVNRPPELIIE